MLNKEKIMYKYKVQVKKVSGRLNESVLPSKNLIVKSKTKKSKSAVLAETSKFFKKKYGLVIESGDVDMYDDYDTDGWFAPYNEDEEFFVVDVSRIGRQDIGDVVDSTMTVDQLRSMLTGYDRDTKIILFDDRKGYGSLTNYDINFTEIQA